MTRTATRSTRAARRMTPAELRSAFAARLTREPQETPQQRKNRLARERRAAKRAAILATA